MCLLKFRSSFCSLSLADNILYTLHFSFNLNDRQSFGTLIKTQKRGRGEKRKKNLHLFSQVSNLQPFTLLLNYAVDTVEVEKVLQYDSLKIFKNTRN